MIPSTRSDRSSWYAPSRSRALRLTPYPPASPDLGVHRSDFPSMGSQYEKISAVEGVQERLAERTDVQVREEAAIHAARVTLDEVSVCDEICDDELEVLLPRAPR